MKYKYLLFDADNTLFDFDAAEAEAFVQLDTLYPGKFKREYYPVYHEENRKVWEELERGEIDRDALKKERFRRYAGKMNVLIPEDDIVRISTEFPKGLAKGTQLLDGAAEILRLLSGVYPTYIITNGLTDVQLSRLNGSKIKKYITRMYISEEIGYAKPDKRFFDAVMKDIDDADPTAYLVIGDSLTSDIDGAAAAGIDACFYAPDGKTTDGRTVRYVIRNLIELAHILL